jgi:hypothetical protein
VYCPSKDPSRIISRNHNETFKVKAINPKRRRKRPSLYECIYNVTPITKKKAENATVNGHGLTSTI